jgi:1-acyl-sn-glycerol-3-phosphate acyltransferase
MQRVIIDEPYKFIPPKYSEWWPKLIQLYLGRHLKKGYGVHSVECRQVEHLRRSVESGHGILLAPNHCRASDPLVLGMLSRRIGRHFHAMASWHLFKGKRFTHFLMRRMGGFSIYREGIDKRALSTAIDILVNAKRPLIVFPEGAISRHNDQLMPLMDGTAFIAHQAAKRRAKAGDHDKVVVHPIAIRYFFRGNVEQTILRAIEPIESHFAWYSQQDKELVDRIRHIGQALLSLKEIEYLGHAHAGDFYQRAGALIDGVLCRLEEKWQIPECADGVVARVKNLRMAIVPDLIHNRLSPEERFERWKELAACYYVQQMSHYPSKYVRATGKNFSEHLIETVERFEEDFTDRMPLHGPWHAVIQVGEAIKVSGRRPRGGAGDPVMEGIRSQLTDMLQELASEARMI